METPEVPTEHLHEDLHHHAEHASPENRWITGVALSSAIIAALAAVSSLLAGHNNDEAIIQQMLASDQWNYYQAKGVKAAVLNSKIDLLTAQGYQPNPADKAKAAAYAADQERIMEEAKGLQESSRRHMENHRLSEAVTIFQIAIALGAISALTRRREFWFVSLVAALAGVGLLFQGVGTWHSLRAADEHARETARAAEAAAPKSHQP